LSFKIVDAHFTGRMNRPYQPGGQTK